MADQTLPPDQADGLVLDTTGLERAVNGICETLDLLRTEREALKRINALLVEALQDFCDAHEATGFYCAGLNDSFFKARALLAVLKGERS